MDALLLDRTTWDLCLDANNNIAVAANPYAVSQNVATACRLFRGELWYDTQKGIPYFEKVLGKQPPVGLMKQFLMAAAEAVPDVGAVRVFLSVATNRDTTNQAQHRVVTGQVQVTIAGSSTILPAEVTLPLTI